MGLMGGTLDPPHYGHLFIAEAARLQCGLEKVLFFPNRIPAHRQGKTAHADPEQRWEMTQAAIADNAGFEASRVELERAGPSYAFDTIHHFLARGEEVFYIIGSDSLADLLTWHRGGELFELCHFIVAPRPGFAPERGMQQLNEAQRAKVLLLETPQLEISSSDIRHRVSRGLPVRYLVPDAVERTMQLYHLYQ